MRFSINSICTLALSTLALALASGSASAALIVAIDDPDTPNVDWTIRDNGIFDGANDTEGYISFSGGVGSGGQEIDLTLTATNLLAGGPDPLLPGGPNLLLSVSQLKTSIPLLDIWVTDTDLDIIQGDSRAAALGELEDASSISFEYYGDTGNAEFGEGFLIEDFMNPAGTFSNLGLGETDPVGSLSIRVRTVLGDDSRDLNATYIAALTVTPIPVPPAAWLFGSALGLLGWIRRRMA